MVLCFVILHVYQNIWRIGQTDLKTRIYYQHDKEEEGWDPANMLNPATFCMYVLIQSQGPVILWLSLVAVLQTSVCFSFIFVHYLGHELIMSR